MVDVVACYVVCNEEAQIAESLRSVKAYVDRYVVIDSIFETNPAEGTHSSDRTREICEQVCAPVPLTYIESIRKLSEQDARNLYLSVVPEGDWVFVIDGDEVIYGDHVAIGELMGGLRGGGGTSVSMAIYSTAVMFEGYADAMVAEEYATNPTINTCGWQPRLFMNRDGLHYRSIDVVDKAGISIAASVVATDALFLVNHHVRQSYAGYQNDFVWEQRGVGSG